MAVFGVPIVREDDALPRCAPRLELRARSLGRSRSSAAVGVNTGEVVAGAGGLRHRRRRERRKRLEQLAAPGEILLGASTYALAGARRCGRALGPLMLKGKAEPNVAFRLDAVDADARAFVRRDDTPLVGRDGRAVAAARALRRVEAGSGATLVTIVGDAGIGKSRLVREAVAAIGPRAAVRVGRCLSYGEGVDVPAAAWAGRRSHGARSDEPRDLRGDASRVPEAAEERPLIAV